MTKLANKMLFNRKGLKHDLTARDSIMGQHINLGAEAVVPHTIKTPQPKTVGLFLQELEQENHRLVVRRPSNHRNQLSIGNISM